jgi:hypothetical protein
MFRLIACLPFVALAAFAAAPVPRDAPAPFGADGLVSRADLEKVVFDSRIALDRDGNPEDDDGLGDVPVKKAAAPRRPNRYDIAVHMPQTRFAAGEPVPAYFVLRNNRDELLSLRSTFDLRGNYLHLHGNGIDLDVRDRKSGGSVRGKELLSTGCGPRIDVPPDGFYCFRGDLNRLGGGLSPGEYEVDWRYGRFRAAAVAFTVLPPEAKPVARPDRPWALHFFHLRPNPDDEQRRWPVAGLDRVRSTDAMVAALAVGQAGPYVPDVRQIPSRDAHIRADMRWMPYRDGDRVAVTLRAANPTVPVRFREVPHLYLQVETPDDGRVPPEPLDEALPAAKEGDRDLVTPVTIEAKLPAGWREWFDAPRARVSVLVASKEIEFPRDRAKPLDVRADRRDPPKWAGVLRTDAVELPLAGNLK